MNLIFIIQIVDENKDEDEYDVDKFYLNGKELIRKGE